MSLTDSFSIRAFGAEDETEISDDYETHSTHLTSCRKIQLCYSTVTLMSLTDSNKTKNFPQAFPIQEHTLFPTNYLTESQLLCLALKILPSLPHQYLAP